MDYQTLIKEGRLFWNDPDPIEGNDYQVNWMEPLVEGSDTVLIHYGGGSEAEVFLSELQIR